jgi:predicted Zn-ribbon and HTH transcriptional regulator
MLKYSTSRHLSECQCDRCGYVWTPRDKNKVPKQCPKCKLTVIYWNSNKGTKP